MKKPLFILIALVLLIACQNDKEKNKALNIQNNKKTDSLTYQTYGLPPEIYYQEAQTSIFAKYGVTVDAVAGCEVTDSLLKAVDMHNDSLFAVLAKKYNNITPDAISLEVQTYAARTKSVAENLKKFDKDKAHLLGKDNYPKIKWVLDAEKDYVLVDYFANRTTNHKPDTLLWKLKVNPTTGKIFIKNNAGMWSEYTNVVK